MKPGESDESSQYSSEQPPSKYSRRKFLQLGGAVGLLAAVPLISWPDEALGASKSTIPSPSSHKKAIIIGSGFGGAITALRLSEKGIESMLIEKGRRWPIKPDGNTFSHYIYPDSRSTWLSNTTVVSISPPLPIRRYVGVLEGQHHGRLDVLMGSCYGGGSIVYGGLHVKPRKDLFERVYPPEISYDELEPYFQRVSDKLGLSPIPPDVLQTKYFTHYRVMERECSNAGIETIRIFSASDWDIVRKEIQGTIKPSIIHGEAIYGVNSGAKTTLDMNYLKEAEGSGFCEVKTLHRVKDIGIDPNNRYLVHVEEIDEVGRVIKREAYSCDYLFLAGGSMGTTPLLVKAKAKGLLPHLNREVGKGWGNNGDVECLRFGIKEGTGQWQGGPPASAIDYPDSPESPLFIEHPQLPLGIDLHCLLYFAMGIHSTRGYFYYDRWTDRAFLRWPRLGNDQERVNKALMNTVKKLNEVNGGALSPLVGGSKRYNDNGVFHPLGGAVLGKACDFYGRVKNYSRLYVNDSSLLPGLTPCANPAHTVAAFAERNIERIIEQDF